MKTTTIEVDSHSAGALKYVCLQALEKAKKELELLKRFKDEKDTFESIRCYLPPTLCNLSYEEIVEQIDPWCSLVIFWEYWVKVFEETASNVQDG